ncbi:LuxR C-terminal-related transcriptional regulator [Streptomyces sp. NBC_01411]|uniref:LuxR C-terminal-related transcriptional regulator n=1 Tax=Streptomyces sp. NBC_01411 TaxID=2903857 RepID=UPI00325076D3
MTTSTVAKINFAPREKQVVQGVADGQTVPEIALSLSIGAHTVAGYLKLAKLKIPGANSNPSIVAVSYATDSIPAPKLLDLTDLCLPGKQLDLVPLTAQGMRPKQMAGFLNRDIDVVRRDARDLMTNLQAKNPAHAVKRAWQYQLLTAEQVLAWYS